MRKRTGFWQVLAVMVMVPLAVFGQATQPAVSQTQVQELVARVGDKDWDVWGKALTQVNELIAAQPKEADMAAFKALVAPLFDRANLGTPEQREGKMAADALVRIGQPAVATLVEKLKSKDSHDRWSAMNILGRIGQPKALVLRSAQDLLQDSDSYVRRTAIEALGKLGADALPAAKDVQQLEFTVDDIQEVAVHLALVRIQGPSKERIAALAMSLRESGQNDAGSYAADVLGDLGPSAASAAPQLRAALRASWPQLRINAAGALGKIGVDDEATIQSLIDCLKNDPELYARQAAAMSLGQIGPKAQASLPVLREALQKEKEWWGWRDALQRVEGGAGPATRATTTAPAGTQGATNPANPQ